MGKQKEKVDFRLGWESNKLELQSGSEIKE